jgi:DNA topoisomerase-1
VAVDGDAIRFEFRAKSGKLQRLSLRNRRLARIVKSCQELPGQELFQYIDEDGVQRDVTSNDVNEYIRSVAGDGFTAKDFRTWAATVLAALALAEFERFDSKAAAKRNLTQAIKRVASRLGNTPAVCRKCYIHPEVMQAYLDGAELAPLKERIEQDLRHELAGLDPAEAAVLAFLQKRLEEATRQAATH